MARDLRVVQYGQDSSGRPLFMTRWMIRVWEAILRHPEVEQFAWKLTIVQGAFMTRAGGGAVASAGYHDLGGCLDVRTWNLTKSELDIFIRVARMFGFAFWRRDESYLHGSMDPHAHGTLGSDDPKSSGAQNSWESYLGNGDGLAGGRPDYEWRPKPLVTFPPDSLLQEDPLMTDAAQKKLDQILDLVRDTNEDLGKFANAEWKRDKDARIKAQQSKKELVSKLGGVIDALTEIGNKVDDDATKSQVRQVKNQLLEALRSDPDVDGAEDPA